MEPSTIAAVLGALAAVLVSINALYTQTHRLKRLNDVVAMLAHGEHLSEAARAHLDDVAERLSASYRAEVAIPGRMPALIGGLSLYVVSISLLLLAPLLPGDSSFSPVRLFTVVVSLALCLIAAGFFAVFYVLSGRVRNQYRSYLTQHSSSPQKVRKRSARGQLRAIARNGRNRRNTRGSDSPNHSQQPV